MLRGLNLFSSLSISVFKDGAKVRVLIKLEEMMGKKKSFKGTYVRFMRTVWYSNQKETVAFHLTSCVQKVTLWFSISVTFKVAGLYTSAGNT